MRGPHAVGSRGGEEGRGKQVTRGGLVVVVVVLEKVEVIRYYYLLITYQFSESDYREKIIQHRPRA